MALEVRSFRGMTGFNVVIESFEEFVYNALEEALPDGHVYGAELSVFDALYLWLLSSEGFFLCPTHESFLAAAIEIIDWARTSEPGYELFDDGTPLWRGREAPVFPKGPGYEYYERVHHPLMLKPEFDSLRERINVRRLINIDYKLDAIIKHLGDTTSGR